MQLYVGRPYDEQLPHLKAYAPSEEPGQLLPWAYRWNLARAHAVGRSTQGPQVEYQPLLASWPALVMEEIPS